MASALKRVSGLERKPLTIERLKEVLRYNQATGTFIWLRTLSGKGPKGSVAGTSAKHNTQSYTYITIDGTKYAAHRLAWFYAHGFIPDLDLDHKDGNGLNNALSNLRLSTGTQNLMNSKLRPHSKSGFKGVSWHAYKEKWRAVIQVDGHHEHIGYFDDPLKAHEAYMKRAIEAYGSFARSK